MPQMTEDRVAGWRSLVGNFLSSAALYPSRNAIWAEGRHVSYEDLARRATRIANAIVNEQPDDAARQCSLFVYRTVTAYAAVLGAQMAGMAYVPLNPRFPARRNSELLDRSRADVMIIDQRCLPHAPEVLSFHRRALLIILPDTNEVPDWASDFPDHRFVTVPNTGDSSGTRMADDLGRDDLAYILFTSGSTGVPKGVAVSHGNVVSYVNNIVRRHGPGCEDRFIHLPDFTFDLSVHDLFVSWAVGACLYCVPEDELMVPDRFVRQHRLTHWTSVPSAARFLNQLGKLKPGAFESLRMSVFCGEPLNASLARNWCAAAPNSIVENLYGPTEATVAFTAYPFDSSRKDTIVPIGQPFPDQEVIICDDDLTPVAADCEGELLLGGSQVTLGYWMEPTLTRDAFVQFSVPHKNSTRWYRTGDVVRWCEGVGLLYRGRKNRQIKIRGYRVEMQEVETILRQVSGTELVAVIAWPVNSEGVAEGLVAFVQGSPFEPDTIRRKCARRLPKYMVPRDVVSVEAIPVNSSGKIDYNRLVESYASTSSPDKIGQGIANK